MTMLTPGQPPPEPPLYPNQPPPGYWLTHAESRYARGKLREKGEEEAIDEFVQMVQMVYDTIVAPDPDPKNRAEGYRNKPDTLWAEQFIYFPKDFADDWADWVRIDPEHANLRDEVMSQVERRLADAGVDLGAYEDILGTTPAGRALEVGAPLPTATLAPASGDSGGTGRPGAPDGAAYPQPYPA